VSRLYSNNLSFQSQSVVLQFFFLTTSTAVSRLNSNNLSFQSQSVVLHFFFFFDDEYSCVSFEQ
jgi:hypothetical protein